MYKKILTIILILPLVFSMPSEIYADSKENIVTRDEFADKIMDCYEYVTQTFSLPTVEQPIFDDIDNSLFSQRILQCYLLGFMEGVGNKKFEPTKTVTKSQTAVALYRLFSKLTTKYNFVQTEAALIINDLGIAPEWAVDSIEYMVLNGIMSLDNGNFYPNDEISEAELGEIIERINNIFVSSDEGDRIDFETFLTRMQ